VSGARGTAGSERPEPARRTGEPQELPESEPPRQRTEPAPTPGVDEIQRAVETDVAILTQIKARLALDPEVSVFAIDVDVDEGVVTLTGTVRSEQARKRAVEIAGATGGVTRVSDRLVLKP
jgi:hypothetical protein